MPQHLAQFLQETVARESAALVNLSESDAGLRERAGDWSRKEELGHLIDSAANNHVRFMRATLEDDFRGPGYEQNDWVRLHDYNGMPWGELIDFWRRYNALLARLIANIPAERLERACVIGSSAPVTLRFLIQDYVMHMQHHIDHILRREEITQYPGAAVGV